jgi:superoxide dismutase, Fe-Mn family
MYKEKPVKTHNVTPGVWSTIQTTARSISRRRFLGSLGIGGAAAVFAPWGATAFARMSPHALATLDAAQAAQSGGFSLPPLPYDYNALEPHIDEATMRLHHDRHHATYVSNINTALANYPDLQGRDIVDLLYHINDLPEAIRTTMRNNGGGHLNHSIFWATMGPNGGGQPVGALADAINTAFGDFNTFKQRLTAAATAQFGSGWGWLVLDGSKQLQVISRPNQDAPVMEGLAALVGVDVWEHAYYLKYNNRRADYLAAWWNTINWDSVGKRYDQARGA